MTTKITEADFNCYAVDEDTAVVTVLNNRYVLDYSTLMDVLTNLAIVAAQVEKGDANKSSPVVFQ